MDKKDKTSFIFFTHILADRKSFLYNANYLTLTINEGWFCDEDGNWGGWCVTEATDKQSHLKEMSEKAEKIREENAEKKKAQEKLNEKRMAAKEERDEIMDKKDENDISDDKRATEQLEEQLKKHFGEDFKGYTVLGSDQVKNPDKKGDVESVVVDIKA